MTLRRRIARLEDRLPPPPPDEGPRQERWKKVLGRFFRLFEKAAALLSPEEDTGVEKAFTELVDGPGLKGPYGRWLRDLQDGWSRMPKLSPAVMKELLVLWSAPGDGYGVVCQNCGLEYPHQNYRTPLPPCPGCKSTEWDWAHLVRDIDRAWKELDGFVGSRRAANGMHP